MARRNVTIRWSLLRNLLLLIALLSGALLGITFWRSKAAVRELCGDLIGQAADRTEVELRRFFEPVTQHLYVARDWAVRGTLDGRDRKLLNELLGPVLRQCKHISSANTGDIEGGGLLLLRETGGWKNREVLYEEWGVTARMTELGPGFEDLRAYEEDLDYDPRTRPWYQGAMASTDRAASRDAGIHWTAPYTFFTTKDPGITASLRATSPDGRPVVLAFDVLLKDISAYTMGLDVSPRGVAFVIDASGRLVGLPRNEAFEEESARRSAILKSPNALGLGPVSITVLQGRQGKEARPRAFEFESDGESWWGGLRTFELEGGPPLAIGVAVPTQDFLGDFHRQRIFILLATALALAVGVALSMFLARRYSLPLEELAAQSERIQNLDTRPASFAPTHITEVARLRDAQESMRSALDSFARYVPTEVVRDLLDRGEAAQIGGRLETLTVLFTDIEGFTSISEGLNATELTVHMAEYFEVTLDLLRASGGTIDKLIGDAIVAFWGAPNPVPGHARRAVEGVLACQAALEEANGKWAARGRPPLPTRFGLTTGTVVVGNVGTPSRLHYTALGDTVNLASRLEGANKVYGTRTLVEARTVAEAGDDFVWRRLDRVAVKGRTEGVDVFELLGRANEVSPDVLAASRRYEDALACLQTRRFDEAIAILRDLDREPTSDAAVQRLLHLARQYRGHPPAEDWDGVVRLTEK